MEIPNVNNLNGAPNFGHGVPPIETVPVGEEVIADASSDVGTDIVPDGSSPETPEEAN